MKSAVEEWSTKTGSYFDKNGKARSITEFCACVAIPYNTFQKYVRSKLSTRRAVGKGVGTVPLINTDVQKVIVHVLTRYD